MEGPIPWIFVKVIGCFFSVRGSLRYNRLGFFYELIIAS